MQRGIFSTAPPGRKIQQKQVVHSLALTSELLLFFHSPRMRLNALDLGRHQKSKNSKS